MPGVRDLSAYLAEVIEPTYMMWEDNILQKQSDTGEISGHNEFRENGWFQKALISRSTRNIKGTTML